MAESLHGYRKGERDATLSCALKGGGGNRSDSGLLGASASIEEQGTLSKGNETASRTLDWLALDDLPQNFTTCTGSNALTGAVRTKIRVDLSSDLCFGTLNFPSAKHPES
jgi:hypothetical protein